VAFLVDSEAYYTTALALMRNARRSIHLLGWAFDPRARLAPDGTDELHDADEVGHVLLDLARARPELDIRLLIWKSALPIRVSHDFFPHKARPWFAGTNVRFRLDDKVPFGAAQHQKVLVIDDAVAICGSADFAIDRWDSSLHLDHDIRRIMPKRLFHGPRHEVMMMAPPPARSAICSASDGPLRRPKRCRRRHRPCWIPGRPRSRPRSAAPRWPSPALSPPGANRTPWTRSCN
jgi:phosphatidylserine/phosphatidylglycerophosphate/cardiolipin synthase-like enzyme